MKKCDYRSLAGIKPGARGPSILLHWNRRAASFTPGHIVAFFVAVPG